MDTSLKDETYNLPFLGQPSREEIVRSCAQYLSERKCKPNYLGFKWSSPTGKATAWIKFGYAIRMREARAQHLVHGAGVKVPRVYRAFQKPYKAGLIYTYILMEYIDAPTTDVHLENHPEDNAFIVEEVTKAVKQMLAIPVPDGYSHGPGPVGGGYACHPFFDCAEADVRYPSVWHLETHFNKVRVRRIPFTENTVPTSFESRSSANTACRLPLTFALTLCESRLSSTMWTCTTRIF